MPKIFDGFKFPEILPKQEVPARRPFEVMLDEMRRVAQHYGYDITDFKIQHNLEHGGRWTSTNLEIEMKLVGLRAYPRNTIDWSADDPFLSLKKPHEMTPEEFEHYATNETKKLK